MFKGLLGPVLQLMEQGTHGPVPWERGKEERIGRREEGLKTELQSEEESLFTEYNIRMQDNTI